MSFCGKCGTENDANAKFCKKCGAPLIAAVVDEPASSQSSPINDVVMDGAGTSSAVTKTATRISPKIIGIICAVVVVVVAIMFFVINAKPKINLNDYVKIETEGYDGYGSAQVNIDWDAINTKYGSKLEFSDNAKSEYGDFISLMTPLEAVKGCVSVTLDNTSYLSNGDELTYTWNVDETLTDYVDCEVSFKDGGTKVSGLTEIETFDAFANLSVSFSGIAPYGTAEYDYSGSELDSYDFYFENNSDLSNGDKVVVKIDESCIEECAQEYGKAPETLEKEYTVEGLNSYITKSSEITDEAISNMKSQAEDVYYSYAAKYFGEGEEVKGLTYLGNYLLTCKTDGYGINNRLFLVYKVDIHNSYSYGTKSYDKINNVYWYVAFSDLMTDGNESVTVDISYYETPYDSFEIDSNISSGWYTQSWYYYGYESLDDLYKAVVTSNLDTYNHEDNIDESAVPAEGSKTSASTDDADYILPNSSTELISEADLEGFDAEQCKIARNEIYARHGRKFKDEELQAYFDSKDWYEGTIEADDFEESMLSDIEIKNKDVIVSYEEENGFR
ncbi:MAG: YARHG domain-containing protein [Lachnospiraceae bacterium]|nr:YARHG domain-containing protein [Lachnospiraceae bacterium]